MTSWTDTQIESLKSLWAGGFSASQIAAQIGDGLSRSAIIGKVHRLKLPGRTRPPSERRTPREARLPRESHPWKSRKRRTAFDSDEAIGLPPDTSPDACTLLELTETSCRYPLGHPDKPDFRYCGTTCDPRQGPYCGRHMRLAYLPVRCRDQQQEAKNQLQAGTAGHHRCLP